MQHHAVLLEQSYPNIKDALLSYGDTSNYEVSIFPFTTLGIGEVKQLILEASFRPREGTCRLLVVNLTAITFEAQQALLKILEEPPATTLFLFITSPELQLLPTVRSRFHKLENTGTLSPIPVAFASFLKSPLAYRQEEITKKMTKKDLVWVEEIKVGLKDYVAKNSASLVAVLPTISMIINLLNTRGASNKMLREELALSLPVCTQN